MLLKIKNRYRARFLWKLKNIFENDESLVFKINLCRCNVCSMLLHYYSELELTKSLFTGIIP